MICPACKKDMVVVEYKKIELDICPECRGVWFDSGELELMFRLHGSEGIDSFLKDMIQQNDAETTEKKIRCPICRNKMNKKAAGETPPVMLDVCGRGHGIWFDGGEVVQLAKHVGTKKKADAGNEAVQFIEEFFNI